jgi:hypothetical protein
MEGMQRVKSVTPTGATADSRGWYEHHEHRMPRVRLCQLPKSQIEYTGDIGDKAVEVELPVWLAEKSFLV